jgi:hypothetical protein
MKRIIALCSVLIGLAPSAFCERGPWLLRVSGGAAWIAPDDLNIFLRDYVSAQESSAGSSARGAGFGPVGRSTNFEVTILAPLEPRLHLLASCGVLRAASTGNAFNVTYPAVDAAYARDDKIRSSFARLGVAYTVPVSGRIGLRPYAAGELYWTTFEDSGSWSYTSLSTSERVLWMDWRVQTRAFDPGFSAGVEIEAEIAPPVRVSLDAGYRRARLSGFKGDFHSTWNFPGGGSPTDREGQSLYYYEYYDAGRGRVFGTMKMPDIWGGAQLTLVRDAVIDLSGPYLRAGLSIAF